MDLWLERFADFVKEIGQGSVVGSLVHGLPGRVNITHCPQIGFQGAHWQILTMNVRRMQPVTGKGIQRQAMSPIRTDWHKSHA